MKLSILAGSTSQTINIFIRDSSSTTGAGLTGLVFNTSSLTAYYMLPKAAAVSITLATLAAVTSSYSSGGFKEIDATNAPGWYRFDIPDAALASGRFVDIHFKGATNMAPTPVEIELTATNNQSATAFITGVNSLAPPTNWNLDSIDASGRRDMSKILGTAISTPATAGILDVNVKNMNNVAATSVTTINANQGTTQPVNFTGTGASALAKSDMVDVAGAAVSTSSAQIGVNAVNVGGTAQTGRDIGASVLLSAGTGTGQIDFTSGVVKANLAQILGTALTETAGQIAAAFKKFFNIATPAATMDHLVLVDTVTTATTATNLTNAPTSGDFTSTMKTSLNNATPSVTVSDKTGFSLSAAGILAIWNQLTADAGILANTFAAKLKNWVLGSDSKALLSSDAQTGAVIPRVTLVDTVTTYTGNTPQTGDAYAVVNSGTFGNSAIKTAVAGVQSDTDDIQTRLPAALTGAGNLKADAQVVSDKTGYALTSAYDFAKGTVAMAESYNADGAAPTPVQSLFVLMQMLTEMSAAGTVVTVKKLDGTTTAFTLNTNDATTPTSITRAT